MLVASDLDGTFREGLRPAPTLVISGRTWAEYDATARFVAQQMPLYIRGTGAFGDRLDAARFKINMIRMLGVTDYWEDDPIQAQMICQGTDCTVHRVGAAADGATSSL